jgi:hypothetical protein
MTHKNGSTAGGKEEYGIAFGKFYRRRPVRFKTNWDIIRNAYIFAEPIEHAASQSIRYPTLVEIAEQYNVNAQSLNVRAQKENWYEKRLAYQQRVSQLHDLEYGAMQLRRSALFDEQSIERLDKFTETFDKWMRELDARVEAQSAGGYMAEGETPVRGSDMKDAIDVMQKMHKLHRDIMGEPVNYYEFYKEKLREERKDVEKGRAVTRSEIRDLISAVRKRDSENGAPSVEPGANVTLDVTMDEDLLMRRVTDEE